LSSQEKKNIKEKAEKDVNKFIKQIEINQTKKSKKIDN